MKNIIRNTAVVALTFISTSLAFAQKADQKSSQLLDAVANKYKSNKNTYFKFAYGTGKNGKVTKLQTGIFYTTPTQYKLKIMGNEQIFDGNKVYNISEEDQEVTIAKATGNEMMFSPTNYLNSYKRDYDATYIGKRNVNGNQLDVVQLKPITANGIKHVLIYLDGQKKQLSKVEQYSTSGDLSSITIQQYRVNQTLSPSMFKFNKGNYSNYLITEL